MTESAQTLVSICMPAYNVARVLRPALESVLGQTYRHIEVVLVDDGSTDGTDEIARSLADPRIRYIRNTTNRGGYQAMNQALALARGPLVAVYHSDDVYEPTIVEKEVAYLQTHPHVGAVFCLDHYIDGEGAIFGGTVLPREFRARPHLEYRDVFPFLLRHKNVLFRCPTFMTRRDVLETVGPFDAERYDIAADLDMWIRILRRFPVSIIDERLMRYRVSRNQWSSRYNYLRTSEELFFAIMDRYLEEDGWREGARPSDLVEYAFHRCDDETFRAANLVIRGDPDAARALLRRPFPWRTFLGGIRRRKVRVGLLRALLQAGLALGAGRPLGRLLQWTEYGRIDAGSRPR